MKKIFIVFIIILLAFFFRFNNLNWDANLHLHPDERFLTIVGTAMKLPTSINQYFDQKTSLMNPENIGFNFFVYGRFPLILTKYLAVVYNFDNYNDFAILGRQLSAFFDLLIIFFIIKTTKLLIYKSREASFNKSQYISAIPYWAGFFYAIAVLPIQLSHFFAVDTFLNFFMFGSFYFALRKKNILSAIFFGLALSCKVTALFILPLNLILISLAYLKRPSQIGKYLLLLLIYFGVAYFSLRLSDPYYFQNKNLFDPRLSELFVENIKSLKNMTVKSMDNWFPPMVQWLNKNTVLHSLINNIIFGLGSPYAILVLVGTFRVVSWRKSIPILIIFFWMLGFFIYQSLQVVPALRYFIFLYPFFAIFASFGIDRLISDRFILNHLSSKKIHRIINSKKAHYLSLFFSVIILLIWPIMFSSIYFNSHTRVEASEWIYKNLPNGSYILSESWDDSLPISVSNNYGKQFPGEQLPVFDPDTREKWQKMNNLLIRGDYYILSSNRGWGSIPMLSQKYPLMSKFYNELLTDRNFSYKKIKEFKPYYYKFFELPNSWVDESFTVYDHPTVIIYKNNNKMIDEF